MRSHFERRIAVIKGIKMLTLAEEEVTPVTEMKGRVTLVIYRGDANVEFDSLLKHFNTLRDEKKPMPVRGSGRVLKIEEVEVADIIWIHGNGKQILLKGELI